jgi:hypothetical protein
MNKINEIFPKVAIFFVFFTVAVTILYKADKMDKLVESPRNQASQTANHQLK